MFIVELIKRIQWCRKADRIGPDIFWTHWRLHFKPTMLELCQRKFKHFDKTADFRPGAYAIACSNVSIGRRVVIHSGCVLASDPRPGQEGIEIQDDSCTLGTNTYIDVNNHTFGNPNISILDQPHGDAKKVTIKTGAWVCANVTILAGVTIGRNSVIGAGSVVTKSIPDYCVAVGNPARVIEEIK